MYANLSRTLGLGATWNVEIAGHASDSPGSPGPEEFRTLSGEADVQVL